MNLAALCVLTQQSAADAGPNWTRALVVIGALALMIAVREAIVWLIHHWPHPSPHARDRDGHPELPRDDE